MLSCYLWGALTWKWAVLRFSDLVVAKPSLHLATLSSTLKTDYSNLEVLVAASNPQKRSPNLCVLDTLTVWHIFILLFCSECKYLEYGVDVLLYFPPCIPRCRKWRHAVLCMLWLRFQSWVYDPTLPSTDKEILSKLYSVNLGFLISWNNNSEIHRVIVRIKWGNICKAT